MSLRKKQPPVKEVIDLETGKILRSEEILSQEEGTHHKQRMADETDKIRNEQVRFHWALYLEAASIRGLRGQSFYFRHRDNPSAECPYRYINSLSPKQINAIKYDGATESARHAGIKRGERQLSWPVFHLKPARC